MVLHKVSASPFNHYALQQCITRMQSQDGLLLTQDAVYAVMHNDSVAQLTELNSVYVLQEDAKARGVNIENSQFQQVNYTEFVALSLEYDKVLSW
jgi:tRNA 2-thiouridine synthesizing protein B